MVFTLREASYSKMSILDFSGQVIATPVDQFSEAGEHALEFDASALAAGLNIIRVESNKLNKTEKLVVIK